MVSGQQWRAPLVRCLNSSAISFESFSQYTLVSKVSSGVQT